MSLPTVSALMGAYNYERYVRAAIESALAQDYPPDRLEVVVVDDGSTDGTADVLAALAHEHPGRVRHLRQANAGYIAATNRAIAEADGEVLALLDADDLWQPAKTRRQVEMLARRPGAALAFSDMFIIDGEGRPTGETLLHGDDQLRDRPLPRLLYGNLATQSSIMFHRGLRERCAPIPDDVPYADWWLAVRAAEIGPIAYSREPLAAYRRHGRNLTGFVEGAASVREKQKAIAFQLAALRRIALDTLTPDELLYVWSGVEMHARQALEAAGSYFVALPAPSVAERERVDPLLGRADQLYVEGDLAGEARTVLRALAHDPYRLDVRSRLVESVARANDAAQRPHPLRDARGFVVLVTIEELLAEPDLLIAYAGLMADAPDATLVVDASRLPAAEAEDRLGELLARSGLADGDVDVLAVTGPLAAYDRRRMLDGADARLRALLDAASEAR